MTNKEMVPRMIMLSDKQKAAVSTIHSEMLATKASILDSKLKLERLEAQAQGFLSGLAMCEGLTGKWSLTPDGNAIVGEGTKVEE